MTILNRINNWYQIYQALSKGNKYLRMPTKEAVKQLTRNQICNYIELCYHIGDKKRKNQWWQIYDANKLRESIGDEAFFMSPEEAYKKWELMKKQGVPQTLG